MHFGAADLPLNRYLVEIGVPLEVWPQRVLFDPAANIGWDAEPPSGTSIDWETRWAADGTTLLAQVPSVIVSEEANVLINPEHEHLDKLGVRKIRKWITMVACGSCPRAPQDGKGRSKPDDQYDGQAPHLRTEAGSAARLPAISGACIGRMMCGP